MTLHTLRAWLGVELDSYRGHLPGLVYSQCFFLEECLLQITLHLVHSSISHFPVMYLHLILKVSCLITELKLTYSKIFLYFRSGTHVPMGGRNVLMFRMYRNYYNIGSRTMVISNPPQIQQWWSYFNSTIKTYDEIISLSIIFV